MEYIDFLQVNHDYSYRILNTHVSTILSIFQPTEPDKGFFSVYYLASS